MQVPVPGMQGLSATKFSDSRLGFGSQVLMKFSDVGVEACSKVCRFVCKAQTCTCVQQLLCCLKSVLGEDMYKS